MIPGDRRILMLVKNKIVGNTFEHLIEHAF